MNSVEDIKCDFCKTTDNDELKLGKLYTYSGLKAHYFCLLLSPNLYQSADETEGILGFMPNMIKDELKRTERLKCYICNQRGASVGCCNRRCRKSFHLPCGIKHKCINQFYGKYESYCSSHSPVQEYSCSPSPDWHKNKSPNFCGICCDEVYSVPNYDTLWTVCCRNGWFHRDCLTNLARNSGSHFFKCPLCNNKQEFTKEMQRMGIYIPDQDASWELEPHAFEDLLYRHNQCDSEICKCPNGRDYDKKNSLWMISLCKSCGSAGSHRGCQALKGKFYCSLCSNVNKRHTAQFNRMTRSSCNMTDEPSESERSCTSPNSISSMDSNNSLENKEVLSTDKSTPYCLRSKQTI